MAVYTAPRAVLPIFNPSDFGIITSQKADSHSFEYWLSEFTTINEQLTALANKLINIGTSYTYNTPYSVTATSGQVSQIGVIPGMTVVGTSPLPMPFFTYLGYIYTNNTSVNATIGYSSNAIDINANVHGNNNTQRWSTSLAGSFTYSAGNVLYITQTTGGNAIQSYPGSVGINDIISVFIK